MRIMKGWSSVLLVAAVALVVIALLAAVGSRLGAWPSEIGLGAYFFCAIGSLVFAIAGAVSLVLSALNPSWKHLVSRFGISVVISAAFLAVSVSRMPRQDRPLLNDVSTDVQDPPQFEVALELRGPSSSSLVYSEQKAEVQQQLHPELKPLIVDGSPGSAFDRALKVASEMGWEVVASDPARGRIEAIATTFWFGFKDDVVIRVRDDAARGSVVDLRSTSRIGKTDLGANAERILEFVAAMEKAEI